MTIRTDAQLANAVLKAQRLLWKFQDTLDDIRSSDHPRGAEVFDAICEEGYGVVADLPHVASKFIANPRVAERLHDNYTGDA